MYSYRFHLFEFYYISSTKETIEDASGSVAL